jgi:hypothetical protein
MATSKQPPAAGNERALAQIANAAPLAPTE